MRTRNRELYCSIFCLFLILEILAQDPKGILQSDATKDLNPRTTHALIIGISDYQDKNIEDLHYAHRDAETFYNWLKSAVGISIPIENIQLLLNQNATNYGITLALYELINTCQKGDQVIIYFSGHGDVQSKTISQPGYLLAYDSPSTVYMGNSLNIRDLQEIITTLTNINHSQVLLITDACHSGKLAGTSINGAQLASHNLAQLFAGETKILSCQPNEYSLEGKQWGGGRGVFSYFLIDGLKGLADYNEDEIVTLSEIDRYLGEMVPAQTGQLQTPFTMGNRNTYLAQVDGNTFLALHEERKKANVIPGKLETRGLEEQLLSKTDSAAIRLYNQFKNSLAEDRLIEPENACAWYYFQQLETIQVLQPLHRILRNNLAVALLDDMQQALNALMNDDPYEINQWQFNKDKYIQYPEYIRRAIHLLGKEHPANKQLESKLLFFEALGINHYIYGFPHSNNLDSIKEISRELLKKALLLDTLDPYVYYLMGNSYLATFEEDPMKLNYEKAIQLAPNWVLPYLELSWEYLNNYYNFEEAQKYILQGIEKKPEHYQLLEMLAWWHQRYNHLDTIQEICRRLRDLRPDLPNDQLTLAFSYQILLKDHTKAIYHFNRAIALSESSPSLISLHWNIAMSYINSRQFDLGLQTLKKDLEMRNDSLGYELGMATYYVNIQKWDLADRLYTHLIERNHSCPKRLI